jgi:hypothetical protein
MAADAGWSERPLLLALRAGPVVFGPVGVVVAFWGSGRRPALLVVLAVAFFAGVFFLAEAGGLALQVARDEPPLRFAAAQALADPRLLLAIVASRATPESS